METFNSPSIQTRCGCGRVETLIRAADTARTVSQGAFAMWSACPRPACRALKRGERGAAAGGKNPTNWRCCSSGSTARSTPSWAATTKPPRRWICGRKTRRLAASRSPRIRTIDGLANVLAYLDARRAPVEAKPRRGGACWRLVEAQHRVSTMKLVDTLDEQQHLEEELERTNAARSGWNAAICTI